MKDLTKIIIGIIGAGLAGFTWFLWMKSIGL
jgi:hypothetical protein